jgi:hypothetical protein
MIGPLILSSLGMGGTLERLDLSTQNISIVKHHGRVTASNACRRERKTMVTLTTEMKEVFAKTKPYAIATASKNGIPNVAPIATVQIVADDTIWIGDNYMVKTLANVRENPHMALYKQKAHIILQRDC